MYHILFYHWVYDNHVYRDEQQQREYVTTGILVASYFGCRPVSMFDTRIKFEEEGDGHKPVDRPTVTGSIEDPGDDSTDEDIPDDTDWDDERSTLVNSDSDIDHAANTSTCNDGDNDTDSDSGTDDEVDTGRDNIGTLLWRYIIFLNTPH